MNKSREIKPIVNRFKKTVSPFRAIYYITVPMEVHLSVQDMVLAFGIVMIGALLQGSIGFGMGPLSAPMLLPIDPVFVPGPLLLSALILII